ncbi:hypothetical protein ABQE48_22590 [Mycolicibacterium thermoresistibile]
MTETVAAEPTSTDRAIPGGRARRLHILGGALLPLLILAVWQWVSASGRVPFCA